MLVNFFEYFTEKKKKKTSFEYSRKTNNIQLRDCLSKLLKPLHIEVCVFSEYSLINSALYSMVFTSNRKSDKSLPFMQLK